MKNKIFFVDRILDAFFYKNSIYFIYIASFIKTHIKLITNKSYVSIDLPRVRAF